MTKRRPNRSSQGSQEVARREDVERLENKIVTLRAEFSGPLPPPQVLAGYENACPGAAERILAMAESQAVHRRDMETRNQVQGGRREWLGMVLGFVLALSAILGGAYLIANGAQAEGLTSIILSLGGLVTVFVYARKEKTKELGRKWEQLVGIRPP